MHIVSIEVEDAVATYLQFIVDKMQNDNHFSKAFNMRVLAHERTLKKDDPVGIAMCLGMVVICSSEHQISIDEIEL